MKDSDIKVNDSFFNEIAIPEKSKSKALDFILENVLKLGFGTLNKSDLDLVIFTCIFKNLNKENQNEIYLSRTLQIPKNKIRSLMEKMHLKYVRLNSKDAISIFQEKCEYASITSNFIDIPINDIRVKYEIENIMEESNILLHSQLNSKIFRLRIADFFELMITFETILNDSLKRPDLEKKLIKTLLESIKKDKKFESKFEKSKTIEDIKSKLVSDGVSVGISLLCSAIPGGVFISEPVNRILNVIKDKIQPNQRT